MVESRREGQAKPFLISIIVIGLAIVVLVGRSNFRKYGAVTVAQVIKAEGAAEGGSLHIVVFFRGQKIKTIANAMCRLCEGKYFFVKILRNNPHKSVIFYDDNPVPTCILDSPLPEEGWKEIPICE